MKSPAMFRWIEYGRYTPETRDTVQDMKSASVTYDNRRWPWPSAPEKHHWRHGLAFHRVRLRGNYVYLHSLP